MAAQAAMIPHPTPVPRNFLNTKIFLFSKSFAKINKTIVKLIFYTSYFFLLIFLNIFRGPTL